MTRRLLLISNSTLFGRGYLEHCEGEIREHLGSVRRVMFIPFALHDRDAYAAKAKERFGAMGFELSSVHRAADMRAAVEEAESFFVGGGNTFRLLKALHENDLIDPIRARVEGGAPYIGSSAGTGVACVTIRTTNDMPIVEPPTFDALNLVPFNINAHYLDADPRSTHMGETREKRIEEFLEENDTTVVGLREGAMLQIEGNEVRLKGSTGARLFRRDRVPQEFAPGASLNFLLASP